MRLRSSFHLRRPIVAMALTMVLWWPVAGVAADEVEAATPVPAIAKPVSRGAVPTGEQLQQAVTAVKADPNFSTERKISTLHWAGEDEPKSRFRWPGWLKWIGALFAAIGQSARVLVWVGLAIAAALLVLYIVRLVRGASLPGRSAKFVAPSHVQDLDIRPESLPPDIGAAARGLWDRGEHRAALALLYRGLLSRLVHVYEVPIRDSSTEGDCLSLAQRLLNDERMRFASRLVRVWQRAVYGGETVETEAVHALCDEFGRTLDPPEAALGAVTGAPA